MAAQRVAPTPLPTTHLTPPACHARLLAPMLPARPRRHQPEVCAFNLRSLGEALEAAGLVHKVLLVGRVLC